MDESPKRSSFPLVILFFMVAAGIYLYFKYERPRSPAPEPAVTKPETKTRHREEPEPVRREALRTWLENHCPPPKWWDRVEAPEITTYGELMRYWQNRERTPEQFFKAAYQAVLQYPDDPTIVVEAVNLMAYGDPTYPYLGELYRFTLENYFDYNRMDVHYAGKQGDTVAGVVREYARWLIKQNHPDEAITWIERLLQSRERDINDHLLQLLAIEHARAYEDLGQTEKAISILQRALEAYPGGDWKESIQQEIARLQQK